MKLHLFVHFILVSALAVFTLSRCGSGLCEAGDCGSNSSGSGGSGGGSTSLFNRLSGFAERVEEIYAPDDGSNNVYVASRFAYNTNGLVGIVKLNSVGEIDTGFNPGTGFNGIVYDITPSGDANGTLYIAGEFTSYNGVDRENMVRIFTDGSIDTNFDTVGAGFDDYVSFITMSEDGSNDVYVAGAFDTYSGTTSRHIARLNSDGSLDTNFNVGTGTNNPVFSLALTTLGEVYVGGFFTNYQGTGVTSLIRLRTNGTLDTDFNPPSMTFIRSLLAEPGSQRVYVARLNSLALLDTDGSIDGSFTSSVVQGGVYDINYVNDGSGDLLIVGGFTTYLAQAAGGFVRINSDGSVDTIYLNGGNGFDTIPNEADRMSNGQIFVNGYFNRYGTSGGRALIRLNSDGSVAQTFGFTGFDQAAQALTVDSTGKFYIAGSFEVFEGDDRNRLLRLNTDGTFDSSFDVSNGCNNAITDLKFSPDQSSLYATGSFTSCGGTNRLRIARFLSDGSHDASFSPGTGLNGFVNDIALYTNGTNALYVGGAFTTFNGVSHSRIVRILSDGSTDAGFSSGTGFNSTVAHLISLNDGSNDLYVVGSFTSYNGSASSRIIRLNSDGSIDGAFASGAPNSSIDHAQAANDGTDDIYISGNFTSYGGVARGRVARVHSDGSVDTLFAPTTGINANGNTLKILILSDGSQDIMIVGNFVSFEGTSSSDLVRVNRDGTFDSAEFSIPSFGSEGLLTPLSISNSISRIVRVSNSNDFFISGTFAAYRRKVARGLMRLNSDGTVKVD